MCTEPGSRARRRRHARSATDDSSTRARRARPDRSGGRAVQRSACNAAASSSPHPPHRWAPPGRRLRRGRAYSKRHGPRRRRLRAVVLGARFQTEDRTAGSSTHAAKPTAAARCRGRRGLGASVSLSPRSSSSSVCTRRSGISWPARPWRTGAHRPWAARWGGGGGGGGGRSRGRADRETARLTIRSRLPANSPGCARWRLEPQRATRPPPADHPIISALAAGPAGEFDGEVSRSRGDRTDGLGPQLAKRRSTSSNGCYIGRPLNGDVDGARHGSGVRRDLLRADGHAVAQVDVEHTTGRRSGGSARSAATKSRRRGRHPPGGPGARTPGGFELPLEPRLPRIGSVDPVALEERAASSRSARSRRTRSSWRSSSRSADRPDDARGRRHARQGRRALLEGDPARPDRPDDPVGRRDLRLPEPRADRGRAPRAAPA